LEEFGGELLNCEDPWWEILEVEELCREFAGSPELGIMVSSCVMLVDFEEPREEVVFSCGGLRRELSACVECEIDFDPSVEKLFASGELWLEVFGPEKLLSSDELGREFSGTVTLFSDVAGGKSEAAPEE